MTKRPLASPTGTLQAKERTWISFRWGGLDNIHNGGGGMARGPAGRLAWEEGGHDLWEVRRSAVSLRFRGLVITGN